MVKTPPGHRRIGRNLLCQFAEGECAEIRQQEKDSDQKSKVADAVDDERFLAGIGRRCFLKPEPDQQVRREAHTFPSDKHQQGIAGQHQHRHEEEEQIQIGEVAPVAFFLVHVTDGVDVNQETDAGDDQQHDQRELVENEAEVDVQRARH